jgi:hypothetical protein
MSSDNTTLVLLALGAGVGLYALTQRQQQPVSVSVGRPGYLPRVDTPWPAHPPLGWGPTVTWGARFPHHQPHFGPHRGHYRR